MEEMMKIYDDAIRFLLGGMLVTVFLLGCSLPVAAGLVEDSPPAPASAPGCGTLVEAVLKQDAALVRLCLVHGQDVNKPDADGLSPLHFAAALGNEEIVKMLLAAGSNVNYQDPWGMAALHAALKEGHDAIARILIEHGADVNVKTVSGYYIGFTPLHAAVFFAKTSQAIIALLLEKGAWVNAKDGAGRTALQMAVQKNLKEFAELLIKHGAAKE
jgi:ankyrin repeat protein